MRVKYLKACMLIILTLPWAAAHSKNMGEERRLDNGLKIIVQPDNRAPIVNSQIWYKVGSAHERNGITGISHALEHMMFKATKTSESGAFSRLVSERGGSENAFTSTDFTAYYQQWAPENLEISFKMEADRMRNLVFESSEFVHEKAVVLEERSLRVDDRPISMAYEMLKANAFLTSPYRNPVIGWRTDIEELTITDLERWYDRYYHPNNATIVVVGDVTADYVFDLAEKHFGGIPMGVIPSEKTRPEVKQSGRKSIEFSSIKAKVPHVVLGYKVPSYKQALGDSEIEDWEPFALEVLAAVLGGFNGARLESSVVRKLKLATSASVSYSWATLLPDLFTISAIPKSGISIERLEKALREELSNLIKNPPDNRELKKVIAQTLSGATFQLDSIAYRAMLIGTLESVGLNWKLNTDYVDNIKAITAEQVAQVAQKYFVPDLETTVRLLPGAF